jgi:hypothetical protein
LRITSRARTGQSHRQQANMLRFMPMQGDTGTHYPGGWNARTVSDI